MKAKHQRLVLASAALVALIGSGFLAMSAIGQRANYFYSPADIAREGIPIGRSVRLGGMVVKGSLSRAADGVSIAFTVSDGHDAVPVRFRGIPPDLFREGAGVVAEGSFAGPLFVATNLLAKHDERYMPPQAAGRQHKTTTIAAR